MKKKHQQLISLAAVIFFLSIICACLSGEKEGPNSAIFHQDGKEEAPNSVIVHQGRFLDSAVLGLHYCSGDQSGFTDAEGTFLYEEGKTVRFCLGQIILGETTGKSIITPIDLVIDGSVSHPTVINICRFLLTLDTDANPDNGIKILPETIATIENIPFDFDAPAQDFEDLMNDTMIAQYPVVSEEAAQDHLQQTLDTIAQETIDPEAVDQETIPEGAISEETAPEETAPEETAPDQATEPAILETWVGVPVVTSSPGYFSSDPSGTIDPNTGSLISLFELPGFYFKSWVCLKEGAIDHPLIATNRAFPKVEQGELDNLVTDNNNFAFKLYEELDGGEDNLVFSPYTFSRVMAMIYAGASGETARQFEEALQFNPEKKTHRIFNAFDLGLKAKEAPVLQIKTAAWGQTGYYLHLDFYNLLARQYCKAIQALDFKSSPLDSKKAIEQWATDHTSGLITSPIDSLSDRVRLACAATANLTGDWLQPFDPNTTADGNFKLDSSSSEVISVPMMSQTAYFPFFDDESYQAIELAFKDSNLAMLLLIPDEDQYQEFEDSLDYEKMQHIIGQLEEQRMTLHLPIFSFTSGQDLMSELSSLSITEAKSESQADFSPINELDDLYLKASKYMTHISVTESGAQGAGSTALTLEGRDEIPIPLPTFGSVWNWGGVENWVFQGAWMSSTSWPPPPIPVAIGRPFIFVISDTASGAILFLGRVMDPRD